MKLGLKRVPPKFYVSTGFGQGHYVFRKLHTEQSGALHRVNESKDSVEQWQEPIKMPSLEAYGLHRLKDGRIVPTGTGV
jgi:hypothetical protein